MAITRDLDPIIKAMKRDKRYKRLKEAFDTLPLYQMKIEALNTELETLHKMREIRRLNVEDPAFVDKIIKANTQDQSTRGRCTEIMMACVRVNDNLSAAIKSLTHHLLLTFTDDLKAYRTKEERLQVVSMVLQPFEKYIANVSSLKESAQLVVTDIDKGNFSLGLTLRALELHVAKERRI